MSLSDSQSLPWEPQRNAKPDKNTNPNHSSSQETTISMVTNLSILAMLSIVANADNADAVCSCTHMEDVDLVNSQQLQALPAQPVRYVAQDSGASMDLLKTACPVCLPSAALSCSQMPLP